MNANDWYKKPRELDAKEMFSPWLVSSASDVTPDFVKEFYAASDKNISLEDATLLSKQIRIAWTGHLLDWSVPKTNGVVLLDHLVAFVEKNAGAVDCFMKIAPTAQPNCYLSRSGDMPVIVYGSRCLVLNGKVLEQRRELNPKELKPIADFAFEKRFPDKASLYKKAMMQLSDVRAVVAIDRNYYDKDVGIVERLGELTRPVIITVGKSKVSDKLSDFRECYTVETESLLPSCIGKTKSIFISDNEELCNVLASCSVKVIAVGCKCPMAVMEVPKGQEDMINADMIFSCFVRAERTAR